MTSSLLIFLAFLLAESNHVVSKRAPGVRASECRLPGALTDTKTCLKTHWEIKYLFSLFVICEYNLVTYFCQCKNFGEKENWYTHPQNQSDSKSFLWWSSSLIEPPWYLTNQIGLALYSGYIGKMATPGEGNPGGVGGDPGGAGGGGPGAGGDPRPIPHHQYAQLNYKPPMFNWDGNQYESFKMFKNKVTILLNGPYVHADGPSKVAAILSWLGDKRFQLYANTDWVRLGKNKTNWEHVLDAFSEHFKPCQTAMQAWYQLGNLYSQQSSNQTDFMTRLKELVAEGGFTNQDEIVKFLFLIHNTNQKGNT